MIGRIPKKDHLLSGKFVFVVACPRLSPNNQRHARRGPTMPALEIRTRPTPRGAGLARLENSTHVPPRAAAILVRAAAYIGTKRKKTLRNMHKTRRRTATESEIGKRHWSYAYDDLDAWARSASRRRRLRCGRASITQKMPPAAGLHPPPGLLHFKCSRQCLSRLSQWPNLIRGGDPVGASLPDRRPLHNIRFSMQFVGPIRATILRRLFPMAI